MTVSTARRTGRRALLAALGMLSAVAMATADARPAHAATGGVAADRITVMAGPSTVVSPAFTDLSFQSILVEHFDGESVLIFWGFDYNPANNHLRAYSEMDPDLADAAFIHTQADPLNLGDRNGVLATASANSQHDGFVLETDPVSCHKPDGFYNSNLHFSIRWADGFLHSGDQTGVSDFHDASVICS